MNNSIAAENKLAQPLSKHAITHTTDEDAQAFLQKAHQLKKKGNTLDAAQHYGALASLIPSDASLAMLAAKTYQQATSSDDAARWFLAAAERYAKSYQVSKAVATLRVYAQLKPEDKKNPKRVYELCVDHGADEDEPPSVILEAKDIASSKLLATDFFKTFDSSSINDLLQHLTYHKFKDGQCISKVGQPAKSLYIIISGAVSGYLTIKGKRTYLGDIKENNICGETAYFTGGRRTAEMIANGETEVFELPYALLDRFKSEQPAFNKRIENLYKSRMLIKQLALTDLFSSVTPNCRSWVAARMKPVAIKAGQLLMPYNENTTDLYMVRSGKLAVTLMISGQERLLKTIETGGIVGETAIVANKKRTASVRAITNCVLMKLNAEDYQAFYAQSKPIQQALEAIKKRHVEETLDLMRNVKLVDGDDTCEILLKSIWSPS